MGHWKRFHTQLYGCKFIACRDVKDKIHVDIVSTSNLYIPVANPWQVDFRELSKITPLPTPQKFFQKWLVHYDKSGVWHPPFSYILETPLVWHSHFETPVGALDPSLYEMFWNIKNISVSDDKGKAIVFLSWNKHMQWNENVFLSSWYWHRTRFISEKGVRSHWKLPKQY